MARRITAGLSCLATVSLLGFLPLTSHAQPADASLIEKGEYLVRAGGCAGCHTEPGGTPYAGGRYLETPFGPISTPNLTPDQETGIGSWSDEEFYRAVHEGIRKNGDYLYPVFPYTQYTKATREDVLAIKAYLFSLPPARAPRKPIGLGFPYNIRTSLLAWRQLYFDEGTYEPDPAQSAQYNRGGYLVEGLAHCSTCHTPRNALGGLETDNPYQGGEVQGWYAPNISSAVNAGIGDWTEDQLFQYLKTGSAPGRGVAIGPMAEVVHDGLRYLSDDDLQAMVVYIKARPPGGAPEDESRPQAYAGANAAGEQTYLNYCASCHGGTGRGIPGAVPALDGNGSVTAEGPENVIRSVLAGLNAADPYGPMPAYGADLSTQEIADVTNYVRNAWSNSAPANASPGEVGRIAQTTQINLSGVAPECALPLEVRVAQRLQDPATGIPETLKGINSANLLERIDQVVGQVRSILPEAKNDEIVNGLTAAYCPVLEAETGRDLKARRWELNRFSQLVYARVTPDQQEASGR